MKIHSHFGRVDTTGGKVSVDSRFSSAACRALTRALPRRDTGRNLAVECQTSVGVSASLTVNYRPGQIFDISLEMLDPNWTTRVGYILNPDRHRATPVMAKALESASQLLADNKANTMTLSATLAPPFSRIQNFSFIIETSGKPLILTRLTTTPRDRFASSYQVDLWPAHVFCDDFIIMALFWLSTSWAADQPLTNHESRLFKAALLGEKYVNRVLPADRYVS